MPDDPVVAAANRTVEAGLPAEIARALGQFRSELACYEAIDSDEAADYGASFLDTLLAVWWPEGDGDVE